MRTGELRVLAVVVPVLVVIEALTRPALLAWSVLAPDSYESAILSSAQAYDRAIIGFYLLTLIVFGRWIYVAGRNLVLAGLDGLQFTPASRIWWFAVPFANFVKPFQGMRELWNASHGADYATNRWLVSSWWALWLGNGITAYLAGRFGAEDGGFLLMLESLSGLILAGIAITLVRQISAAQLRLSTAPDLTEVFA